MLKLSVLIVTASLFAIANDHPKEISPAAPFVLGRTKPACSIDDKGKLLLAKGADWESCAYAALELAGQRTQQLVECQKPKEPAK